MLHNYQLTYLPLTYLHALLSCRVAMLLVAWSMRVLCCVSSSATVQMVVPTCSVTRSRVLLCAMQALCVAGRRAASLAGAVQQPRLLVRGDPAFSCGQHALPARVRRRLPAPAEVHSLNS